MIALAALAKLLKILATKSGAKKIAENKNVKLLIYFDESHDLLSQWTGEELLTAQRK